MSNTFLKLTKKQSHVFEQIACNCDQFHDEVILQQLLKKQLIEKHPSILRTAGQLPVNINNYSVPINIHIEWCAWCAKHVKDIHDSEYYRQIGEKLKR